MDTKSGIEKIGRFYAAGLLCCCLGAGTAQASGSDFPVVTSVEANTYFGVTPAGAAASGLPAFAAEGGIIPIGIQPMVAIHMTERWHLGAGVRYSYLTGDPGDSPVVDDRGSKSQLVGGLGVVYSWGARVNKR